VTVNPNGSACRCGSIGCWETEIGERVLLQRAGRDPDGGDRAISEVLAAAEEGDARACAALDQEACWLAVGIAGLANIFDPDLVVLGGFFGRILPAIRGRMTVELSSRGFGGRDWSSSLIEAALGADSRLIGAGEAALTAVLNDPSSIVRPLL
jgi:predicted NBD/HSP70 family sugar kinase